MFQRCSQTTTQISWAHSTSLAKAGIGTEVIKRLIGEAARVNQTIRLNVVKINPAVRLYEPIGFQVIGEDDRRLYMKRDPVTHLSN
jgi:ribosomal protein S18 acetylase RimI-like enzyme